MYSAVYNHYTWKLNWCPVNILGDSVFYLRLTWFYSPYELTSAGWNSASIPPSFLGGVPCFTVQELKLLFTSLKVLLTLIRLNEPLLVWVQLPAWSGFCCRCVLFSTLLCVASGGAFLHQPFVCSLSFRLLLQHAPFLLSRSTVKHLCGAHDTENKIPMIDTFTRFGEKQLIAACSFSTAGRTLMMP